MNAMTNEGIHKLRREVAEIRTMLPGPPTQACPIVLGGIHPNLRMRYSMANEMISSFWIQRMGATPPRNGELFRRIRGLAVYSVSTGLYRHCGSYWPDLYQQRSGLRDLRTAHRSRVTCLYIAAEILRLT